MKPKFRSRQHLGLIVLTFATAAMSPVGTQSAHAASDTWNVNADGNWVDDLNWTSAAPGSTSSTTNTDTATFGTAISAARIVTVDANRNIQNIDFAGNSSGYTLSGGNLLLTAGGTIQTSGGGSGHTDTINTAITLQGDYTFGGNSTTAGRGLTFGTLATITSAATSGTTTLTLNGTTTAANNLLSGIISNGTGTNKVAISKSGTGTWTLSAVNTYTGGTTVSAGTLLLGNDSGAGTGTITLSGGTLGGTASRTLANTILAAPATSSTLLGTGTLTLNGTLTGSGTLNIASAVNFGNTAVNATNASKSGGFTGALSVGAVLGFNSPNSANGADYYYNLSNAAVTLTTGGSIQWNMANGSLTNDPGVGYFNFGSISSASGVGTIGLATGGGNKISRFTVGTLNTDTTYGGTIIANGILGTALAKVGSGTLILTGTNTYAGSAAFGTFAAMPATTIRGGTLQVGDGTSGSLASTGALTFLDTGRFNYQGQTAGSSQSLGALTFSQGAGTVQSTYGTSGNTALTFSSLVARTAGATGNFVVSGGTNGTTNKIVLTGAATGSLLSPGTYFNGTDFAAYDTGGFVRALNYGTDTSAAAVDTITAANHVKLTATPANQNSISLFTLNLSGSGTSWTQNAAQTLTLSGGGLIKSGGGTVGTISGGTGITTGGAQELVIRTDASTDLLTISTPILSSSTGGLTKSGEGTLTLSAAGNAYTGATRVNEGTLVLSGTYSGSSALTVNNSATVNLSGAFTTSGVVTVANGSGNGVLNVNSGGTLSLTNTLLISNSGTGYDTGSGTVNVNSGGTISTNNDIVVGVGGTQTGTMNIASGATVNFGTTTLRWFKLGQSDTGNGVVNLNGGTLNLSFNSDIRFSTANGSGTNVFNQNSGNVTVWSGNGTGTTGSASDGMVDMQQTSTSIANNTYNLNGGTLTVNRVGSTLADGTRTFNFNGGTLKAFSASAAATFFTLGTGNAIANVRNGGAIIDTNNFSVTISQALLHSNVSGDNATDGGLTKNNTGTLTLTGANTYTGNTSIVMGNSTGLNNASILNLSYAANQTNIINNTANSSALILGGSLASNATTVLGGGQLTLTGVATSTNTQRFNGMTVGTGGNNIVFANSATANPIALNVGAISRTVGGTLHITQPAGTVSTSNGVQTSTGTAGTILTDANGTAYATVGGTAAAVGDWAAKDATNPFIVGLSTVGGYTTSIDAGSFSGNADVTASFTANAGTTVNSIRMNDSTLRTLNINSSGNTTVSTGGVLFGSTVNSVITGTGTATLVAGAGRELVFINTNTGTPQLNAVIADSASGASSVTYRALQLTQGNGQFAIGGAGNTYLGNTYIESGRVATNVSTAFGTGAGANVYIDGNTNGQAYLFGGTFANHFYLIGNGWNESTGVFGALRLQGATVSGQVTLLGNARIGSQGGTGIFSNVIDDGGNAFALDVNSGTTVLTAANTYTGATTISAGTLQLGNAGTTGSLSSSSAITTTGGTLAFNRTDTMTQGTDFGSINGTGTVSVNSGTVAINGSLGATTASGVVNVGQSGNAANARLNILSGATVKLNTTNFNVGNGITNATGQGFVYQSGGAVSGINQLVVGANTNAYGYYNLSGGTLGMNELDAGGFNAGSAGVVDMSGGTMNVANYILIGRGGSGNSGVLNMTGGTLNYSGGNTFQFNWGEVTNGNQKSVLNIANASLISANTKNVDLMRSGVSTNLGEINLLSGGLLQANGIAPAQATGTSLLNFNGGTLKAFSANATFLTTNLTAANIFSGGGTIDNNGIAITIPKALVAPAGSGANSNPTVTSGGSGYVGAPLVTVTGATGTGAAAYATVSGGQVTGIVVTNPGTGYTGALSFALTGGGGTGATIGTVTQTTNTSGGMTFAGTGTTTLAGANTYDGTTVNAGTVTVGTGGTLGATTGALSVNNPNAGAGTNVVLNLATAVDTTVGSLSGTKATPSSGTNAATINNGGSGRNFTVNQTTAGTYAGVIAGAGSFTLGSSSTNTLTLSGANTYTGATNINSGGTLALGSSGSISNSSVITVNGTLDTSAKTSFTIGGTQTLNGNGTVTVGTGNVMNIDGTLAAGNSPGEMTVSGGTTTLDSGSIFAWELNANVDSTTGGTRGVGGNYDGLTTTNLGNLTVNSGAIFQVILTGAVDGSNAFWNTTRSWANIFSIAGTTTPAGANLFDTVQILDSTSGSKFNAVNGSFTFTGSTLTWSAVPEPSSALAGLLVVGGLLRRRRA